MRVLVRQFQYMMQLYFYKMTSTRTISLLIIQLLINYLYCKPVMNLSQGLHHQVTPWIFPFMISEYHYAFLFLMGIIYYFSDVPFMQHGNMYQVIRMGRKKWVVGQIGVIIMQAFTMIFINIAMSMVLLFPNLEFSTGWGKILYTASMTNVASQFEFFFPISYDTLTHSTPISLMLITVFVGGLVISFIGLLMFAISLLVNRMAAVAVATGMTTMIFFVENVHHISMVKMGMFTPANWIRTANIGKKMHGVYVVPPLPWMFGVLGIGIIVMAILTTARIKRVEFHWNRED